MKGVLTICFGILIGLNSNLLSQEKFDSHMRKTNKEVEQLKTELKLSDEQVEKVKQLYIERDKKLKENRPSKEELASMADNERDRLRAEQITIRKQSNKDLQLGLKNILSEDQMKQYKIIASRKRRNRLENRSGNMQAHPKKDLNYHKEDL